MKKTLVKCFWIYIRDAHEVFVGRLFIVGARFSIKCLFVAIKGVNKAVITRAKAVADSSLNSSLAGFRASVICSHPHPLGETLSFDMRVQFWSLF